MAGRHMYVNIFAVAVLLVASTTTCRGYPVASPVESCNLGSNIQSLLPCMTTLLEPSYPTGQDSGCCSALKVLSTQDNFIDCLCNRYDSKPDSCKEALHNIRC
ncbi:hypothetical protein R1flu_024163 [Riccia fluitans]|uniref:Bifunctional inhibitor/plant lipid transfer protein/seed storage helical domain-containing protein n=1 Tax=Riccia fluitans TaxID=41844 RepID=A0ABD1XU45_9MARC